MNNQIKIFIFFSCACVQTLNIILTKKYCQQLIQIVQYQSCIPAMQQLQCRVRRSSRVKDSSAFREFLEYARMVKDEDDIYFFMEENQIGIDQPEFWAAKLSMLAEKGQFQQFVKKLSEANRNIQVRKSEGYFLIEAVKYRLEKQLQNLVMLFKSARPRGRRGIKQYELFNVKQVLKQTRKFGKLQIYVDEPNRNHFKLQDFVEFVTTNMPDKLKSIKKQYQKNIQNRPLSFLGRKQEEMHCKAKQQNGGRISKIKVSEITNHINSINNIIKNDRKSSIRLIRTPSKKKTKEITVSAHNKANRKQSINNSEQLIEGQKSGKKVCFLEQFQLDKSLDFSSIKKQKVRGDDVKQQLLQQFFVNKDDAEEMSDLEETQSIIFETLDTIPLKIQKEQNENENTQTKTSKIQIQNTQNIAFIQFSQPNQNQIPHKSSENLQVELENVIRQYQMLKYESQTQSQIDSNKQNNMTQTSIYYNNHQNSLSRKQRIRFETIKKSGSTKLISKNKKYDKSSTDIDDSSGLEDWDLQNIAGFVNQMQRHSHKNEVECDQNRLIFTEKDKKRISRISQQRSYSHSEIKNSSHTQK